LKADTWIWVIVQDAGGKEQYFGQQDAATGRDFIPAFHQKEDAQRCLGRLVPARHPAVEIQAVCYGDLARDAAANGFGIVMLNADGEILARIRPDAD
jgi:hypothetical protein